MAEVKPKVEGKVKTPRLEMMFVLSAHITSAIQVHIVNGIPLVIFFFFFFYSKSFAILMDNYLKWALGSLAWPGLAWVLVVTAHLLGSPTGLCF